MFDCFIAGSGFGSIKYLAFGVFFVYWFGIRYARAEERKALNDAWEERNKDSQIAELSERVFDGPSEG